MSKTQAIQQLPTGWKWVKVSEIAELFRGINYTKDVAQNIPSETHLPILRGNNINGELNFDDLVYVPKDLIKGDQYLKKDDIVFAMSSGSKHLVGKSAVAKADFHGSYGAFCALLRVSSDVDKRYVAFIFKGSSYRKLISEIAKGTNINNLKREHILNFNIPLPPLPTQQAIVAKIEALFSEVDKGTETLRQAQQQLKVYRQAVLESAFKGHFTHNWRNKYSNKKTAEQIIKQISAEKEKIVKSNGLKLPLIEAVDKEKFPLLPELPESWTWITPDEISSPEKYSIGIGPFGSNLKVSDYKTEGVPLVFVKNITRNNFTLDLKFISNHKLEELIAHSIKPLDILITKMGDPPGDCTIYPEDRPTAVITSDCLKFRVWDKFSNRKYFKYCFETNIVKKQLGLRTKGVAQKKISSSRFKTILFPFTKIEEQNAIVQAIESRLSVADKLEESIAQSLQQAEALKQSILKKAFEGRLI